MLWSTLFKYHLELGHFEEAYEAMMANPDTVRCDVCACTIVHIHVLHSTLVLSTYTKGWHWLTCVKCVHKIFFSSQLHHSSVSQ